MLTIPTTTKTIKYDGDTITILKTVTRQGEMEIEAEFPVREMLFSVSPMKEAKHGQQGYVTITYPSPSTGKLTGEPLLFDVEQNDAMRYFVNELHSLIEEKRAECSQCHHIWFYDYLDELDHESKDLFDMARTISTAGLLPNDNVADPRRCPKCGSRAVDVTDVVNKKTTNTTPPPSPPAPVNQKIYYREGEEPPSPFTIGCAIVILIIFIFIMRSCLGCS